MLLICVAQGLEFSVQISSILLRYGVRSYEKLQLFPHGEYRVHVASAFLPREQELLGPFFGRTKFVGISVLRSCAQEIRNRKYCFTRVTGVEHGVLGWTHACKVGACISRSSLAQALAASALRSGALGLVFLLAGRKIFFRKIVLKPGFRMATQFTTQFSRTKVKSTNAFQQAPTKFLHKLHSHSLDKRFASARQVHGICCLYEGHLQHSFRASRCASRNPHGFGRLIAN